MYGDQVGEFVCWYWDLKGKDRWNGNEQHEDGLKLLNSNLVQS